MKKHGRYGLASVEDIAIGIMNGEKAWVSSQIQRIKAKHKNEKNEIKKRTREKSQSLYKI